jgi:inorganic pyrophosphatase
MTPIDSTDYIGKQVKIVMDRPMGSLHPRFGDEYPVNYGYVPGTLSGDGAELDAYVLGIDVPLDSFQGTCIAVIRRLDDDDDKLIVVPSGTNIDNETIRKLTHFQEQYFESKIIRGKCN